MENSHKTLIADMDGTLCDVRSVRHHVLTYPKNYDKFHEASVDCPPHYWVADSVQRYYDAGWHILVVTARKKRHEALTSWWLAENGIPSDELFMREDWDNRKDYLVKKEILDRIRNMGYRPTIAYDDNPAVIKLWEREGLMVRTVPGWVEAKAATWKSSYLSPTYPTAASSPVASSTSVVKAVVPVTDLPKDDLTPGKSGPVDPTSSQASASSG